MSEVTLKSLSVSYEGVQVVHELDLTVASGEWLSLIGPNGAGKTTILRAIARLVPFQGDVLIGGQAVTALSSRNLARGIAMLVQEPQMPAGMTVSQYVLLGRAPHLGYLGKESSLDRRVVRDVLRRLVLEELAPPPPEKLSGGERQRAAIVRALAQRAAVLLIDEPPDSIGL